MAKKSKKTEKALKPEAYKKIDDSSKHFYLCDGRQIGSMAELLFMLQDMDHKVFCLHVNENKNDFANWIRDVFEEKEIAKKIEEARTPEDMRRSIFPHLTSRES